MGSPFYYGEAVTGENFADRQEEMAEIFRDPEDGHSILLVSPRRYGRTSL